MEPKSNVVLIGMSGAGKSTLGVLLAKARGMQFTDTDLLIQQREGRLLQQILDEDGTSRFLSVEEDVVTALDVQGYVIATGGSVVYSDEAMRHLKKDATVIYLFISFEELCHRLSSITTRGIVFKGANDLFSVYKERLPLYEKYADITVDCTALDVEASLREILSALC